MHNPLTNAHKGYEYQDLVVAIGLVKCLVNDWIGVRVDKKSFSGDAFDDLVIETQNSIHKYQIKHSDSKEMSLSDLSNSNTDYLLRVILESIQKDPEAGRTEYHLSTTWSIQKSEVQEGLAISSGSISLLGFPCLLCKIEPTSIKSKKLSKWIKNIEERLSSESAVRIDQFNNLTIHAELPGYSSDLYNPGNLEHVLIRLLIDNVGIGRYPNKHRNPADFAAHVIKLATRSRKDQRRLTKVEIERELQLNTDFGRLPQEIPIDSTVVQQRHELQSEIEKTLDQSKVHVLRGGPGTGKSWLLSLFTNTLSDKQWIVGKHHCYISPADEDPRLATSEVAIANIVAEILDKNPKLGECITTKYSVGVRELQELINHTSEAFEKTILIIDGLDHIPRLLNRYPTLSPVEANIIEPISQLTIPDNCVIIFGTQPGEQLNTIINAFKKHEPIIHDIPNWSDEEIKTLTTALGIRQTSIFGGDDIEYLRNKIAEKSEGNPLYATYIIKSVVDALQSGDITRATKIVEGSPHYNNDINTYYEHLVSASGDAGAYMSTLLAAMPFSIERCEIEELLGNALYANYLVTDGLKHLAPVLSSQSNVSGIRIFHESFRRYILEKNDSKNDGGNKRTFDAIAEWLTKKGFYQDVRSFTYLFQVLANSSKPEIVFDYVSERCLEKGFNAGFNISEISGNLSYAMTVASKLQAWPVIVRIMELNRALYSAEFNEIETSFELWSFGVLLIDDKIAKQKLISNGEPYLSKYTGLKFCRLLHENGSVAPWDAYLEMQDSKDEYESDARKSIEETHELSVLKIYGECCVGNGDTTVNKVVNFLKANKSKLTDESSIKYIKQIVKAIHDSSREMSYVDEVFYELIELHKSASGSARDGILKIMQFCAKINAELWSDLYLSEQVSAIEGAGDIDAILNVSSCGANVLLTSSLSDVARNWTSAKNSASERSNDLAKWLRALDIVTKNRSKDILEDIYAAIPGDSWYELWLKFCTLRRLATLYDDDIERSAKQLEAFSLLSEEVSPFVGKPRSCDLYYHRNSIEREVISGLGEIIDKRSMCMSMQHICNAINKQATSLSGSPSGPISPDGIAQGLIRLPINNVTKLSVSYFARWLKWYTDTTGSYSDYFRDWYAACAALYMRASMPKKAKRLWAETARFVFGYGFRKDITYYELLKSFDIVKHLDEDVREFEIEEVQKICESVVRHTDGRSTSAAPIEWFSSVMDAMPHSALQCLSDEFDESESYGWYLDEATIKAATSLQGVSPQLRAAILIATPYSDRTLDVKNPAHLEAEIALVCDIHRDNPHVAAKFANILLAKIQGQTGSEINKHLEDAKKKLTAAGIQIPCTWRSGRTSEGSRYSKSKYSDWTDKFKRDDAYSVIGVGGSDVSSLTQFIQRIGALNYDVRPGYARLVEKLGYSFVELSHAHGEEELSDLLHYLKEKTRYSIVHEADLFFELGDGFHRYNLDTLAIHSYLICVTIQFGSWSKLTNRTLTNAFKNAYEIDPERTLRTLTEIIGNSFQSLTYSTGWTAGVINLLREVNKTEDAYASWQEAKEVIKWRLPADEDAIYFPKVRVTDLDTPQEVLLSKILLGLSKHPSLVRRYYAYNVLSILSNTELKSVAAALATYLTVSCSFVDTRYVFALIQQHKQLGLCESVRDVMRAYSENDYGTLSTLAKQILDEGKCSDKFAIQFYEPPPSYHSFWGSEGYVINYFPGFANAYKERLDGLRKLSNIARYNKLRGELAYKRTDPKGSLAPIVHWHHEICEVALDAALNDVVIDSWKSGRYDKDSVNCVAYLLTSLVEFDMSLGRSLVPRPCIPLPSNVTQGFNDIEYGNDSWVRVACFEIESFVAWNRRDNRGDNMLSALFIVPSGERDEAELLEMSLPITDPMQWLYGYGLRKDYIVGSPIFNLLPVGNASFKHNLVVLAHEFANQYKLKMNSPFEYKWYAEDGTMVAYTNAWIERDPESYNDDRPGLVGSELLVTPSLYEDIRRLYGRDMKQRSLAFNL
jgi:hypothetical protein